MPRKPTQARSKNTVQAIVNAGFISISKHGLANVTTRHIADDAGVSVGSLYEYFSRKEDIFEAMAGNMQRDAIDLIESSIPTVTRLDLREAVLKLTSLFRDLLERDDGRYLQAISLLTQTYGQTHMKPIGAALLNLALQFVVNHPQYTRVPNLPALSYVVINGGVAAVVQHLSDPHPPINFEQLSDALARMIDHYAQGELALIQSESAG